MNLLRKQEYKVFEAEDGLGSSQHISGILLTSH
jgi:hypothetical protein